MNVTRQLKGMAFKWVDRVVPVKPLDRAPQEQCSLDRESRRMQLYFSPACAASVAVRRRCQKLGLKVVQKDVQRVDAYRNELAHGGGAPRVPCLRVERENGTEWLYSEEQIVDYLCRRFSS